MRGGNILVGSALGIISGKYIFEEPLQQYWTEKRAEEAAAKSPALISPPDKGESSDTKNIK